MSDDNVLFVIPMVMPDTYYNSHDIDIVKDYVVQNKGELDVYKAYISDYTNELHMDDFLLDEISDKMHEKYADNKIFLICFEHSSPYGLHYSVKYSDNVAGIICFPLRLYSKESYDRRIWKFKEKKGWEKSRMSKYDIDDHLINATDETLKMLRKDMDIGKDMDIEKDIMYKIFDLNLQKQWVDIPKKFKVPTYIFSRLDMDVESIIKLNFARKHIADMKGILTKDDALLNSIMWNFDRVKLDKELLDTNDDGNGNLKIHYIIGGIHTAESVIDALKIMMTDFFSVYRYKYHKYKHKLDVERKKSMGGIDNIEFMIGSFDDIVSENNWTEEKLYNSYNEMHGLYFKKNITIDVLKVGTLYLGFHNENMICAGTVTDANGEYFLYNVFVHTYYRRQGVCTKLIREIIDNLKAMNNNLKITLNVRKDNKGAIKCYSSSGFKIQEESGKKSSEKYTMVFENRSSSTQTYADNNKIYSVDMMFKYINDNELPVIKVPIRDLLSQMENDSWDGITPKQVIDNPSAYPKHNDRIQNADLSYPIIINEDNYIIDGMHRLAKAYIDGNETIDAYIFINEIMEKFAIGTKKGDEWSERDWDYSDSLTKDDIDALYNERFG